MSPTFTRRDLTLRQWLRLTLIESPTEPFEFALGWFLLVRGLWVAMPWWAAWESSGVYHGYLQIAPDENFWGALDCGIGVLLVYGLYRDIRRLRLVATFFLAAQMATAAIEFVTSDWRSPAWIWGAGCTATALWMLWRLAQRQRPPGRPRSSSAAERT